MIRSLTALTASALILAACATPGPTDDTLSETVTDSAAIAEADTRPAPVIEAPASAFELAMGTVEGLVEAGNTQTAIDRLTQLLGNPNLTEEELAEALVRRGELRFESGGYDVEGAISDFQTVTTDYADTDWAETAGTMLDTANGKLTSINFLLGQPETSRLDRFNLLMDAGQHQDAIDLMIAYDLVPANDTLVAMYQIGYLCESDELSGRSYAATEPDGTERALQFCDFGK